MVVVVFGAGVGMLVIGLVVMVSVLLNVDKGSNEH